MLGPQITHEVKGMDPAHSDLVALVSKVQPIFDLLFTLQSRPEWAVAT